MQLLLAVVAQRLSGATAAPTRVLRLQVQVAADVEARLHELEQMLTAIPDANRALTHAAALWLALTEQLPFVNGGADRGSIAGRARWGRTGAAPRCCRRAPARWRVRRSAPR